MDKVVLAIASIASFLNSLMIIIAFTKLVKKPVDNAVDKKFQAALAPVKESIDNVKEDISKLDKNQCMNYLVEYIEDKKKGVEKGEIQHKRASDVYDHYTKDLNGNSYIHDGWEKYCK